jgi:hypothetical protein
VIYDDYPALVLAFHGCRRTTYETVMRGLPLAPSRNSYDWLGWGVYFWENSYSRALDWALQRYAADAAVIGAVIDPGHCLNLTDFQNAQLVRAAYDTLVVDMADQSRDLPVNRNIKDNDDWLLRDLDCAVVNTVHDLNATLGRPSFDTVRGIFTEGPPAYPGAGFRAKTHVQLCVRNAASIKGYFAPRDEAGDIIRY